MTKEKILFATLELAAEKGLGNVSLSMIAERVNIRKASIFSHYKSKDDIINNMYIFFRNRSIESIKNYNINIDDLCNNKTLEEILLQVVNSYNLMTEDPYLLLFYKVVMSERCFNVEATKIMAYETDRMIKATADLFYILKDKKIAKFDNVLAAAILFANAVHSLLDFKRDCKFANVEFANDKLELFINEFANIYRL